MVRIVYDFFTSPRRLIDFAMIRVCLYQYPDVIRYRDCPKLRMTDPINYVRRHVMTKRFFLPLSFDRSDT